MFLPEFIKFASIFLIPRNVPQRMLLAADWIINALNALIGESSALYMAFAHLIKFSCGMVRVYKLQMYSLGVTIHKGYPLSGTRTVDGSPQDIESTQEEQKNASTDVNATLMRSNICSRQVIKCRANQGRKI